MILDLLILLLLGYGAYYGYKKGPSKQMYDFFKVFVGLTLASHYSGSFGLFLTRKGILAPDNWAVLLLIGFISLFVLYWVLLMAAERYFGEAVINRSGKAYNWVGAGATLLELVLILSLMLFFLAQFKPVKSNFYNYMHKSSMVYPVMEKGCSKLITVGLVDSLVSSSGGSTREILFNTLTDKETYKAFTP